MNGRGKGKKRKRKTEWSGKKRGLRRGMGKEARGRGDDRSTKRKNEMEERGKS